MRRRLLLITSIKDIQDKSFIFTIDTTKTGTTGADSFLLPAQMDSGTTDYEVDWGDGNGWVTGYTGHTTKTYDTGGVYTVKVKGNFDRCSFGLDGEPKKVLSVEQWGITKWATMQRMFYQTDGLIINAIDEPDLTAPNISMREMFSGTTNFNQDIGGWDVSNVINMQQMFQNATSFNQDIGGWDVSNVTNMLRIFNSATNFNQDISGWDVSNVINMSYVFESATNFNQDISGWDVSNATNMANMFRNATSFNKDIGAWDVSNVTNMTGMFQNATNFNQDLSQWCVSLIPSVPSNFDTGANAWTLPRPVWGTCPVTYFPLRNTSVDPVSSDYELPYTFVPNDGLYFDEPPTDFKDMFRSSTINDPDIGLWDTSNVTDMSGMFREAVDFNQDIGGWDVSNVTNMSLMFQGATNFNQDISGWDVSNVTNMQQMFPSATNFNQDLGGWDVSNVTSLSNMFLGVAMSTENYSNTLIGWSNNPNGLQWGRSFHGGYSKYNAQGEIARQYIINTYGWSILDGGLDS